MIIITGMHRSGTSLLSLLLQRLGADFGPEDQLIAGDQWNQDGYLENARFVELNNQLILGCKVDMRHWSQPATVPWKRVVNGIFSGRWRYFLFPSASRIEQRAKRLETSMRKAATGFRGCFVKDPRFCITAGAWSGRSEIEGTIFCFRHPHAVTRSIGRRDLVPTGFADRFWLYHQQSWVRSLTGNSPVALVHYDQFFTESFADEMERLVRFLERLDLPAGDPMEACSVIDKNKRHHVGGPEKLSARVSAAFTALMRVHEMAGEPLAAAELRRRLVSEGFPV